MPANDPDPRPALRSVLILGGTAEARALAAAAAAAGASIISSLAGRVVRPALPVGPVRIGGFGGTKGLTEYLGRHGITAVVDATHPFAATMSGHAAAACAAAGVPLLRLARPGWADRPDAADWHWVGSTTEAAARAKDLGGRVFLTTGRQSLPDYACLAAGFALVRVVEPPTHPLPPTWELILDRGPYALAGELELMRSRQIEVLATKDSGGHYTAAKLQAAQQLRIPVVVIRRPSPTHGVENIDSVPLALQWLLRQ